jgi:glycosyltransferase involved in cell wall biosynthesis
VKILQVVPTLTVEDGGVSQVVVALSEALAMRGHAVTIRTVDVPGTRLASTLVDIRAFPPSGLKRLKGSRELRASLKKEIPAQTILHCHGMWETPTNAAAALARKSRVPYIITPHGMLDAWSINHHYPVKYTAWLLRDGKTIRHAAGVHCLNAAEIRRAPWLKGAATFIVGNGIAKGQLENLPAPGAFRAAHPELGAGPFALFLSRIHPKKGLERFLREWPRVLQQCPAARLVIAGTGNPQDVQAVKDVIHVHELGGTVHLVGQLVGKTKWQALVDAAAFILPTHQEGFSMAVTEALAAACPVVITHECNFDEVAEANAGIIIEGGDMPAFAVATGGLLTHPAPAQEMGQRGRHLVAHRYTWDRIAEQMESHYARLTNQNR